jgi:site-specific recombinase XerD
VQGALAALAARLSSRTVQIAHNVLVRAIRQAERDDLVARNVAALVKPSLDDHNVRRQFRVITEAAGLGSEWVPRELRHTFVSLLSAHGVPVEAIALLAGHNQTATTELVYRHQIVPALTRGAEVMDQIFG